MFINYRLEDGSTVLVEVTEETASYILENDREMANADRKERYHCPYHIEAMEYEGRFPRVPPDAGRSIRP